MSRSSKSDGDPDASGLATIRETWIMAAQASDADRLAALVTEGVVLVQGNGTCVCGKDELKAYFQHKFGRFDVEPRVTSVETIVHDKWGFEVYAVESAETTVRGSMQIHAQFRVAVIFARQPDGSWKVARLLEFPD